MKDLVASEINADLSMVLNGFETNERIVPSALELFKLSGLIPALSLLLSFVSSSIVYFSGYKPSFTLNGFLEYFLSDGWVFFVPALPVGLLFMLMAYNNMILYLAIPNAIRTRSLVIEHLKIITQRTVLFFVIIMLMATLLSAFSTWLAFAVPALEFALLFAVNMIIGMEINRLGAGLALEKISNLIKKI